MLKGDANAPGVECLESENVWRAQTCKFWFRNWPASFSFASRVAVVSKSFEGHTDKTEEWYGTQYRQEDISDATVEVLFYWSPSFSTAINTASTPKDAALPIVSEMGECRPQRQVQITDEKWVHPNQLWDLPSGERVSISPHSNQGKCSCRAFPKCHHSCQSCVGNSSSSAASWPSLLCFPMELRFWIRHLANLLALCPDQTSKVEANCECSFLNTSSFLFRCHLLLNAK